jgi:hypothetical protein
MREVSDSRGFILNEVLCLNINCFLFPSYRRKTETKHCKTSSSNKCNRRKIAKWLIKIRRPIRTNRGIFLTMMLYGAGMSMKL